MDELFDTEPDPPPALEKLKLRAYLRGSSKKGDRAYKMWKEFDRLRGFLRFSPDRRGRYLARCAPDYFILPLLGDHFLLRFGSLPWAIVDEKRNLVLLRDRGKKPALYRLRHGRTAGLDTPAFTAEESADPWEELWREYHRSINNTDRTNPELQRQFMPKRYWKYLPEMK
ncbi:MAG: TIGR03915 family putative DNA repair protein [Spirochaetaceae bacterium]|jgi:probable DNA metabolism protein|nr:TIGR03915 family putative DNA repair protein [Spirochaetaceae bacterium]